MVTVNCVLETIRARRGGFDTLAVCMILCVVAPSVSTEKPESPVTHARGEVVPLTAPPLSLAAR